MSPRVRLEEKFTAFSSDSQLLSELGERLIATPDVALAELIKNAYDADATKVNVWLAGPKSSQLIIQDNGHGMTEEEFLTNWMKIATTNKLARDASKNFRRSITGSKGVGRFAVRRLGRTLTVVSVAAYPAERFRKLTATFEWEKFKGGRPLDEVKIPYTLEEAEESELGTTLAVGDLQEDWSQGKLAEVTGFVLDLISPPFAEIRTHLPGEEKRDPGFSLYFSAPGKETTEHSAASELYGRYLARVNIDVGDGDVSFKYEYEGAKSRTIKIRLRDENLVGILHGEIRYYPKRSGRFAGLKTIDGRRALSWLRENGGVRVIDRKFRVLPYGEPDDDWLKLSASKAVNAREWGSNITKQLYPEKDRSKIETEDPLLKVPGNHQILGAVFVESYRPVAKDPPEVRLRRLQPAMDRQGFVENDGFNQMTSIVRAAVELLAVIDVEETAKQQKLAAREKTLEVKREIRQAIQKVEKNPDISKGEKRVLIRSYERIAEGVARMDEAHERARKTVETMALLGVLAGFMTHEATVMLSSAQRMLSNWKDAPKALRGLEYAQLIDETEKAIKQIRGHLDYARVFIGNLREARQQPFKVSPQVNLIAGQFKDFTDARNIRVENKVSGKVMSPPVGVSVYSGLLVNLFTNGIKAVMGLKDSAREKVVRIDAFDEGGVHVLRVSDSGIGIPFENRARIFDPAFSTTGNIDGPLGTGMGLGLHIVRTLVHELGGQVGVVDPPRGFSTCFELRLPK